jgi:hypothetical protein
MCRAYVIGATLLVSCCIFLVPCKFVYLNLAFADRMKRSECEHGMFEKELPYAGSILSSAGSVAARFDAVLQHDNQTTG